MKESKFEINKGNFSERSEEFNRKARFTFNFNDLYDRISSYLSFSMQLEFKVTNPFFV